MTNWNSIIDNVRHIIFLNLLYSHWEEALWLSFRRSGGLITEFHFSIISWPYSPIMGIYLWTCIHGIVSLQSPWLNRRFVECSSDATWIKAGIPINFLLFWDTSWKMPLESLLTMSYLKSRANFKKRLFYVHFGDILIGEDSFTFEF